MIPKYMEIIKVICKINGINLIIIYYILPAVQDLPFSFKAVLARIRAY